MRVEVAAEASFEEVDVVRAHQEVGPTLVRRQGGGVGAAEGHLAGLLPGEDPHHRRGLGQVADSDAQELARRGREAIAAGQGQVQSRLLWRRRVARGDETWGVEVVGDPTGSGEGAGGEGADLAEHGQRLGEELGQADDRHELTDGDLAAARLVAGDERDDGEEEPETRRGSPVIAPTEELAPIPASWARRLTRR